MEKRPDNRPVSYNYAPVPQPAQPYSQQQAQPYSQQQAQPYAPQQAQPYAQQQTQVYTQQQAQVYTQQQMQAYARAQAAEVEKAKRKESVRRGLRIRLVLVLAATAAIAVLSAVFFPVYRVSGTSMSPTVSEGEIAVAVRSSKISRGDIVALSYSGKAVIKRVIACPGQTVDIDENGDVYVDGQLLSEPYLSEKAYGECSVEMPYRVPSGRYFVMGDNRAESQDSRNVLFGCVAEDQIVGKIILHFGN